MAGYVYDTGLITNLAKNNGDVIQFDLEGFERCTLYFRFRTVNATMASFNLYSSTSSGVAAVYTSRPMVADDKEVITIDLPSKDLRLEILFSLGAANGAIDYRLVARG